MNKLASRRAFLRGKVLRPDRSALRPPGAVGDAFYDLCHDCDACVRACPEGIIAMGADGWPALRFDTGHCIFCQDCANACPTGALDADQVSDWPWRATFAATCLSMNGTSCRMCQDACDADALRFRLLLGGRSEPVLNTETCTGCGACATACPVSAVSFERPTEEPIPEITQ